MAADLACSRRARSAAVSPPPSGCLRSRVPNSRSGPPGRAKDHHSSHPRVQQHIISARPPLPDVWRPFRWAARSLLWGSDQDTRPGKWPCTQRQRVFASSGSSPLNECGQVQARLPRCRQDGGDGEGGSTARCTAATPASACAAPAWPVRTGDRLLRSSWSAKHPGRVLKPGRFQMTQVVVRGGRPRALGRSSRSLRRTIPLVTRPAESGPRPPGAAGGGH